MRNKLRNVKGRVLAIFLAATMGLTSLPAYADEYVEEPEITEEAEKDLASEEDGVFNIGDVSPLEGYAIDNSVSGNNAIPVVEEVIEESEEISSETEIVEETESEEVLEDGEETAENEVSLEESSEEEGSSEEVSEENGVSGEEALEENEVSEENSGFEEEEKEITYEETTFEETIGNSVVTVTGKMPENATISIAEVSVDTLENIDIENFVPVKAYDITIRDENGEEFQPMSIGEVLSISVSNVPVEEEDLITIRVEDDASVMEVPSFVEDGEVVFEAEHFTIYVVGKLNEGQDDEVANPYLAPDGNEYTYVLIEDDDHTNPRISITHIKVNNDVVVIPEEIGGIPVKHVGDTQNIDRNWLSNAVMDDGLTYTYCLLSDDVTHLSSLTINSWKIWPGAFAKSDLTIDNLIIGENVSYFGYTTSVVTTLSYQFKDVTIGTIYYNAISAKTSDGVEGVSRETPKPFYGAKISKIIFGDSVYSTPNTLFYQARINTDEIVVNMHTVGYRLFGGGYNHFGKVIMGEDIAAFTEDNYSVSLWATVMDTNCSFESDKIDFLQWNVIDGHIPDDMKWFFSGIQTVQNQYSSMFSKADIGDFAIGENVTVIPNGFLMGAKNNFGSKDLVIDSANFSAGKIKIGLYAFAGLDFNSVTITGNIDYPKSDAGYCFFYSTIGTFTINDYNNSLTITASGYNKGLVRQCNVSNVIINEVSHLTTNLFDLCKIGTATYNCSSRTNWLFQRKNGYFFSNCGFTNILFGSNTTMIPSNFIYGDNNNSLTSFSGEFIIPEGVTDIGYSAVDIKDAENFIAEKMVLPSTLKQLPNEALLIKSKNTYVYALTNTIATTAGYDGSYLDEQTPETKALYGHVYIHRNSDYFFTFVANYIRSYKSTEYAFRKASGSNSFSSKDEFTEYLYNKHGEFTLLCDDYMPAELEHKNASCLAYGGDYGECSLCHYEQIFNKISPLGHDTENTVYEYINYTYGHIRNTVCKREVDGTICNAILKKEYSVIIKPVSITKNEYLNSQNYKKVVYDDTFSLPLTINGQPYGDFGSIDVKINGTLTTINNAIWVTSAQDIVLDYGDIYTQYSPYEYATASGNNSTIVGYYKDGSTSFSPSYYKSLSLKTMLSSNLSQGHPMMIEPTLYANFYSIPACEGVYSDYDGTEKDLVKIVTYYKTFDYKYVYIDNESDFNTLKEATLLEEIDFYNNTTWNDGLPKETDVCDKNIVLCLTSDVSKLPLPHLVYLKGGIYPRVDYTVKYPALVSLNDYQSTKGYYGTSFDVDIILNTDADGVVDFQYYSISSCVRNENRGWYVRMFTEDNRYEYFKINTNGANVSKFTLDSKDTSVFFTNAENKKQSTVNIELFDDTYEFIPNSVMTGEFIICTKFTPEY